MLRQQYKRNLETVIIDRMKKSCAVCAVGMKVILYEDRSYRGGHYFFGKGKAEYWECPKCYWKG